MIARTTPAPAQRTPAEQALFDAMARLFDGRPQRTDGRLIKNNLYREAGVSRATMNRATTVLAEWDARMAARGPDKSAAATDEEVAKLRADLSQARRANQDLQQRLEAAATVIGALHADNVQLRSRIPARGAPVVSLPLARLNRE